MKVEVCVTLQVFLLGVVGQGGGHGEAHVAVFAAVRLLARVQPHVVLEGRAGGKLCAALLTREGLLFKVLTAFVVDHP